ncbi:hypothetical protein DCU88_03850 [Campylobacter upsaliensis]|nr:hypothetical protein [Campylobacter upsaliensis]
MMKRVSVYNKSLNFSYVFLGIFFIFYEILSSVFSYLPLFYGFFFCYMFMLLVEREKTLLKLDFRWYFSLFFLLFADITHDFFPFSSWIAFFIFYYALAGWIKTNLKMSSTTPIVFVFCAYLFVVILELVFSYANNEKTILFSFSYFISICFEALFAFVFFKGKI